MRDFLTEYMSCANDLAPFYAAPLRSLFETPPLNRTWDPAVVEAIREDQRRLGGNGAFNGDEAVVVTGQQTGLFTGPLYTIYKAVTAVRLAALIRERTGTACVPVFWVGGDDHDFDEVKTAHFLSKSAEPFSIEYAPEADVDHMPMHRVPLEAPFLHAAIDRAVAETRGSEFRNEIAAFLHNSLDDSVSFSDWFGRILARLFRDTGLIVFSPDLAAARAAAVPVLEQEIRHPLASTALLNGAGAQLERIGFGQQVVKGDTEANFFLEVNGRRRKILFEEDRYVLPEEDAVYSKDDLLTLLNDEPGRFSPNVALRCVVQQHLFPAAAYVAGPGELAYWAQLKPVFDHFDLPMPIVYPRARCVLTRVKLSRLMRQFGFTPDELTGPQDALVDRALETASDNPGRAALATHRAVLEGDLAALEVDLASHDATAGDMVRELAARTVAELDRINRVLARRDETQVAATQKQVARLCAVLAPWRKPQERVYTVFSFLFEQGWGLIGRLLNELDIESFSMNEVEL